MQLRHSDGKVHFSDLKQFRFSPAHYRQSILHPKPPTPAMQRGTAIDRLVLGGRLVKCDVARGTGAWKCIEIIAGARNDAVAVYSGAVLRGAEYEKFASANPDKAIVLAKDWDVAWETLRGEPCDIGAIVVADEYDTARRAADAVLANEVVKAERLLVGDKQRVIEWEMHGLPFAAGIAGVRGGFDVLGATHLADLKGTVSTQPEKWKLQAERMCYHAQLACYDGGALAIGYKLETHWLIGVELRAPHNVTCLRVSRAMLERGRALIASWCEQLRACEQSDFWPGYVQAPVDWEPNEYEYTLGGDDDE